MNAEPRWISLIREADWWVARDDETGITCKAYERMEALESLDETVRHAKEMGLTETL